MNIKQIKLLANNKKHLEQLEHEVLEILNSGGGSTQITESWTETYTLNKNNIFNYVFLQILLANINATELSSENEYAEHYKLLRKTMQEMFPNVNYKIKIEFYDFIFFYYAEINEWDIEKLILESDDSILFDNMRTFCNLLPQIKLDPTKTLSILTFFDEKGKNDLATGRIYIALEKMIKNDDKYGLNLLDEIQKTDDYRFVYLISKNLSSLSYDHLVKYLKKLYKSKNVDEAVAALGAINFPDSDTANEISAFIKDEIVKENDFPANIVIAFLSILKNSNMLTEDNLNYLISYLEEALQRGSIETKYTFLNRITHIEIQDHDLAKSLKEKFLFESIDIGKDHVNLPRAISFLLRELSTAEQILKFIEKWALKHEFSLEPFFDWIVSDIYLKDTQGFQEALLPMLISGNPSIRHYANHIIEIEEIDLLKDIEIWSTIVSKLTAQSALYLMESILVLFSSIELRIQLLMPLSNSKDSTITNHLLQRFVWLTEVDYFVWTEYCIL